ncbi:AAA family ATPase [bacterium]|nr:AAA family ATPase [bacterium]
MTGAEHKPLAERMRPQSLSEYIGQEHLVGPQGVISNLVASGKVPSMIFWGPPGVGKTTLALLIAKEVNLQFFSLSAIQAGVKEVRQVLDAAKKLGKALLFIDEIHRFNKSQQDALLGAVENGTITLIGATTENPSFEVIPALLSRCQVYVLKEFSAQELLQIVQHALINDSLLKQKEVLLTETHSLLQFSGGDARKLLNLLELAINSENKSPVAITDALVQKVIQQKTPKYDKNGEQHYDIISAFIKSMRGSDPNAAVYYLARMLKGGEDVKFIARRMLILASEDIGNANPTALVLANNCFQAVNVIGMPEARILLSQTAIYLATSPKSNASYAAIDAALAAVDKSGDLSVPLHLRNAPTKLMKNLDYGKNYKYAHSFDGNFAEQEFLPDDLSNTKFYEPGNNDRENAIRKWLRNLWKGKYNY